MLLVTHVANLILCAISKRTELFGEPDMPNKVFSAWLNDELDEIGVPQSSFERIDVFAKLLKVPKFKAEGLLNGLTTPDEQLLSVIADELEVDSDWLIGKTDDKTSAS